MTNICIIQARLGSTRLPGKVLADLGGHPVLAWVVRACQAAPGVDQVWVATTTNPEDKKIVDWCIENDVNCLQGSEKDVLGRFVAACEVAGYPDVVLRVTGDEPFIDPYVIGLVVRQQKETGAAYCSNIHPRTFADGMDVECFTKDALLAANQEATREIDRDTVTYWIFRNAARFPSSTVINPIPRQEGERYVLDTQQDLDFCRALVVRWPWGAGPPSQLDIIAILDQEPALIGINVDQVMNERFFQAIADEAPVKRTHTTSAKMLERAKKTIPLGAQTFSKSYLQYPQESPLFVTHGQGGLVYDVDGHDYVDLVGGLLPNILGYADPDIDFAIRQQLNSGISFSLATELERKLAEKLCELIPCAEMVRFGKNGTDVTTAAVRLARYITGRDMVLSSGYHGWADTFVARDPVRHAGIPGPIRELTENLRHGDTESARKHLATRAYACVIVEPETDPVFLRALRAVCTETGTLLIFDEIITGFRFHLGGAQAMYGVTPDLATFGKSMANGMPISALVGKRKYMEHMEKISFSGTFFSETLALAAAMATIEKMEREPVLRHIHNLGEQAKEMIMDTAHKHGLKIVKDMARWELLRISFAGAGGASKEDIKTLWMQTMIQNGVLIINSHNFCYAHTQADMQRIAKAYDAAFVVLKEAIETGTVKECIVGESVKGSANVRAAV